MKTHQNLEEFCTPLIQIQSLLADIQDNEYDFYLSEIEKCQKISEEVLFQELLYVVPLRPVQLNLYVRLVGDLSKEQSRYNGFCNRLLSFVINNMNCIQFLKKNLSSYIFIRVCYNEGIFPIQLIQERINEYIRNPLSFLINYPLIVIAFLDIFRTELFISIDQSVWKRKLYLFHNESRIITAIQYDDIQTVRELMSHPSFNKDMSVPGNILSMYPLLRKELSLIQLAAFYGSGSVFKNLFIEGHNINGIAKYAIYGGNLDILHIVFQNNEIHDGSYKYAVKYHRNDVFRWLLINQNKGNLPGLLIESLLDTAIKSNSIRIITRILESCDLNTFLNHKPLHLSCMYGFLGLTAIFCKFLPMLNEKDENGFYPIHVAAKQNRKSIIKILLKVFPDSGFALSKSNTDAFLEAFYEWNIGICSLLDSYGQFDMFLLINANNFLKIMSRFDGVIGKYINIDFMNSYRIRVNGYKIFNYPNLILSKNMIDLLKPQIPEYCELFRVLMGMKGFNINTLNNEGNSIISLLSNRRSAHKILEILCSDPNLDPMITNSSSENIFMVLLNTINASLIPQIVNNHKHIVLSTTEITRIHQFMVELIKMNSSILFLSLLNIHFIDVNFIIGNGDSFLHIAVKEKRLEIVKGLLNHPSCDPKIPNYEGLTPFQLAGDGDAEIFSQFLGLEKLKNEKMNKSINNKLIYFKYLKNCKEEEDYD